MRKHPQTAKPATHVDQKVRPGSSYPGRTRGSSTNWSSPRSAVQSVRSAAAGSAGTGTRRRGRTRLRRACEKIDQTTIV